MRVTLRVTSIALFGESSDQGLTATNMTDNCDIYGVSDTTGLVSVVVGHYWIGLGEGRIGFGLVSRGRGHYWIGYTLSETQLVQMHDWIGYPKW